jgi:hypothetical protein
VSRLDSILVKADSQSSSDLLGHLLHGSAVRGAIFGRRDLRFGDYIVSLTAPGSARMPNGIECRVGFAAGARVSIGGGRLVVGRVEISPGPDWDPVPAFERFDCLPPGPAPSSDSHEAMLGGIDAASDERLAGYLAGLVLFHGQRVRAEHLAWRALAKAGPLTGTLLRHAARGEVPEGIHDLLASRSGKRLIASSPSAIAWLRGFVSAGLPLDPVSVINVRAGDSFVAEAR